VEFALQKQKPLLEKYGFEPSLRGVIEMRSQTRALTSDAVILKLLRDIHALLEARKPLPTRVPWRFQMGWRPSSEKGVSLIQSSWDTGERLQSMDAPNFEDEADSDVSKFSGPVLEVHLHQVKQEILGFGTAFTEASALVFQGLDPDLQQEVLELYFGEDGIGLSLGRVHINSCDFSLGNYCFDSVEEDFDLEHFDMQVKRDCKALIPLIRAAELCRKGQLRLVASPWSPPAWMKVSQEMNGSSKPGLRPECQDVWARYIATWISAYEQMNIQIWAVTVQNEPEHNAPWEACCYTAEEEAEFVANYLGPTLQSMHPKVQIFIYDHNKDHVYDWACQALGSMERPSQAQPFVHGIAFHWYAGDHFDKLQKTHKEFPDAILLATEACYERHRWKSGTRIAEGDWSFGEGYAHDIMGNLNAGAAGWIDWNMLLDDAGGPNHVGNVCDSPLMASVTDQELYVHPQFFFLGHFSKYVQPGSKSLLSSVSGTSRCKEQRIYGTCTAQDGLESTAFLRSDGAVVVVVLNAANLSVNFKLRLVRSTGAVGTTTSIPARSIQTYVLPQQLTTAVQKSQKSAEIPREGERNR